MLWIQEVSMGPDEFAIQCNQQLQNNEFWDNPAGDSIVDNRVEKDSKVDNPGDSRGDDRVDNLGDSSSGDNPGGNRGNHIAFCRCHVPRIYMHKIMFQRHTII